MALGYQARAMLRGLAKLGEPSLLAGVTCGNVALERNVEVFAGIGSTADDNAIVRYTVASIAGSYLPRVSQTLTHPDGAFVLDRMLDDNGHVRRFIVVPA